MSQWNASKGTEAAKEAAVVVLLDDNFATIVAAVHEGRTVYDNIRKVIAWTLPTNDGETLCVVAAIVFSLALPMTTLKSKRPAWLAITRIPILCSAVTRIKG